MVLQEEYVVFGSESFRISHLTDENDPASPVLVFLHDALGSIDQWNNFPAALAKQCHLNGVVIERQGHGKSSNFGMSRSINYLHDEASVILPKILDALHIHDPILVGHSDGASIALLHAAEFKVRGIVSIAAHVFVEEITIQGIRQMVEKEAAVVDKLFDYHKDKAKSLFKAWSDTWLSEEFLDFNIERDIQTITEPLLVIQSDNDAYGSIDQADSILKAVRSTKKEKYLVIKGGHSPHLRNADEVLNVATRFIREL